MFEHQALGVVLAVFIVISVVFALLAVRVSDKLRDMRELAEGRKLELDAMGREIASKNDEITLLKNGRKYDVDVLTADLYREREERRLARVNLLQVVEHARICAQNSSMRAEIGGLILSDQEDHGDVSDHHVDRSGTCVGDQIASAANPYSTRLDA
jgi:hypothetical protein